MSVLPIRPLASATEVGPVLWPDPDGLTEVNLDYAATTPALVAAAEAVRDALPWYGSLHRGGGRRSAVSTTAFENAREAVALFAGATDAADVIFVRNTTEAANLLAAALPPASRVLCTPFEHHANLLPWRQHRVDHLPFTPTAAELVVVVAEAFERARRADDPYTLLAITAATNVTGECPPVAEIAALAREHHTQVFADAAQLAPHRPLDIAGLGVDYLAFSGHKVYAPFGTGALVARRDALTLGSPLLHGGGAVRLVTLDEVVWAPSPRRYEAGTPNLLGAVALGAACDALRRHGMSTVADRERGLAHALWDGLDGIDGIEQLRMWPDAPDRVGVAAFNVRGWSAHGFGRHLADHGIAVRAGSFCAHPLVAHLLRTPAEETSRLLGLVEDGADVTIPGAVRASIGLGTTAADIAHLVETIEQSIR